MDTEYALFFLSFFLFSNRLFQSHVCVYCVSPATPLVPPLVCIVLVQQLLWFPPPPFVCIVLVQQLLWFPPPPFVCIVLVQQLLWFPPPFIFFCNFCNRLFSKPPHLQKISLYICVIGKAICTNSIEVCMCVVK